LWQQALLLLVAQHAPALRSRWSPPRPGDPHARWAGSDPMPELQANTAVLLDGLQAGRSAQEVQGFILSRLQTSGPEYLLLPCVQPWGKHILHCAMAHRAPELLAWSLRPLSGQRQGFWGPTGGWLQRCVFEAATQYGLTPITCRCLAKRPHGSQPCGRNQQQRRR
jgi:hypothetical protein